MSLLNFSKKNLIRKHANLKKIIINNWHIKSYNLNVIKKIILIDSVGKTKDDIFEEISKVSVDKKIIESKHFKKLKIAFIDREKQSTTGFEDGFAIPHARIAEIKKPIIFFIRTKNGIEWNSMDGSKIKYIFALLIPEKNATNLHLEYLSKLATLLLDESFRDFIKNTNDKFELQKYLDKKIFNNNLIKKNSVNTSISSKYKIIGVSACATGVVHTYMAKKALEDAGTKSNNYSVKIETQGQKGIEFGLSAQDIEEADAVVAATDIYVDLDKFEGKKVFRCKTNDAIARPLEVLKASLNAPIHGDKNSSKNSSIHSSEFKTTKGKIFMGHLLSGVSRMIPFIVFSGIVWAIINSIGFDKTISESEIYKTIKSVSKVGFTFFIAIMGGFIAESIAGRAGFAVGMMTTFVAANPSFYFWWNINGLAGIPQIESFIASMTGENVGLSLFAAIMMGFASGYLVKWVNSWNTHKLVTPLMPIIFIPVVCTSVIVFPFVLLLSGPLGYLMNGFVYVLSEAAKINGVNFLIGLILGMMIGFDMGGPINKIAGTTATALIVVDPRLMGAVAAAIPIAPLGCGLASLVGKNIFSEKEKAEGVSALGLGFFGISEGAIPFAVKRPKQVLISNVLASGVAGGLAFLFYCGGYVGMWGGPITALVVGVHAPVTELAVLGSSIPSIFGGAGNGMEYISVLWFFVAIIAATILHASLFIMFIKLSDGNKDIFIIRIYRKIFKQNSKVEKNIEKNQKIVNKYRVQQELFNTYIIKKYTIKSLLI